MWQQELRYEHQVIIIIVIIINCLPELQNVRVTKQTLLFHYSAKNLQNI
jgi:hypothetical protein